METNGLKPRGQRNRTLELTPGERQVYVKKLLRPDRADMLSEEIITNRTICADLLQIVDRLPASFADLIIIDPPYNLDKNFHGYQFKAGDQESYRAYLRSWFPKVVRLLRKNGSLYLCGDWKCTAALQLVMEENLYVVNRITWQRE